MRKKSAPDHGANNTAVGYLRRSTDRQEQSIPDQRSAIEAYASAHELVISRFYTDDAISGTSTAKRAAFLAMIADAQSDPPPFQTILVYDVKRFGRLGNDEAGYYRHLLHMRGVEVIYVTEQFNGDSIDDLLRPVKQWQAREESKDLSKVTIRGALTKVSGGWWMGGVPPYGYDLRYQTDRQPKGVFLFTLRYLPDRSKQLLDEEGRLIRSLDAGETIQISKRDRARLTFSLPERVEVVREIFRRFAEDGLGDRAISDLLNKAGVPSPRAAAWSRLNDGTWSGTTVRSILINPIYVGDMVWNRRTEGQFHRIAAGRAVERRGAQASSLVDNPETDWIRIQDTHPAIVSRRLFDRAQLARASESGRSTLGNARIKSGWNGCRARFLLSGLIVCARCGLRYHGMARQGSSQREKEETLIYGCSGYLRIGKEHCRFGPVGQRMMERFVFDAVIAHYEPLLLNDARRRLTELVRKSIAEEGVRTRRDQAKTEAALQRIEARITQVRGAGGTMNDAILEARVGELADRKARILHRMKELACRVPESSEVEGIAEDTFKLLTGLRAALLQGNAQERFIALRRCVSMIVVDVEAGTATIKLRRIPSHSIEGPLVERTIELPCGPCVPRRRKTLPTAQGKADAEYRGAAREGRTTRRRRR